MLAIPGTPIVRRIKVEGDPVGRILAMNAGFSITALLRLSENARPNRILLRWVRGRRPLTGTEARTSAVYHATAARSFVDEFGLRRIEFIQGAAAGAVTVTR